MNEATLLLNALDSYGPPGTPPLIDDVVAKATARALPQGRYAVVPGNHITMVFGAPARTLVREIASFVKESTRA